MRYYERLYRDMTLSCKLRGLNKKVLKRDSDVYYEVHHIIPKYMGGSNEKTNLVLLTAREHLLAHWLLTRFLTGSNRYKAKMAVAAFLMNKDGRKLTIRQMASVKKANAEASSKRWTENNPSTLEKNREASSIRTTARMTGLAAQGKHPKQSDTQREAESERCSKRNKVKKTCSHCGTEANSGNFGKYHGVKCESLTSYILATHLATGRTETFKTLGQTKAHFDCNVHSVVSGECHHAKGWHFKRVLHGS